MTEDNQKTLEDLEQVVQEFEKSPIERHRIQARGIRTFGQVVQWWTEEVERKTAQSSDGMVNVADLVAIFTQNLSVMTYSCLIDMPLDVRKFVISYLINYLESETGDDLLPDREEIDKAVMEEEEKTLN